MKNPDERSTAPADRLAVLGLALSPLLVYAEAFFGPWVLARSDGMLVEWPLRALAARMVRAGEAPLWNPFIHGGYPLLGHATAALLQPAAWWHLVCPPEWAVTLGVATSHAMAAVGMYLFVRRLGAAVLGGLVAGLMFSYGGFLSAHLMHTSFVDGAAWLPWGFLAVRRLAEGPRLRSLAGLALAVLFSVCGHPPIAGYALAGMAAYAAWEFRALSSAARAGFTKRLLLGAASGLALSGIFLLPALELTALLDRTAWLLTLGTGGRFNFVFDYSLPILQTPMLLFPHLFGHPFPEAPYAVPYWGRYWGVWNLCELSAYAGMVGTLLALAGLALRRIHAPVKFWVGLAAAALLLAWGRETPLAHLMVHVPFYNAFRVPARSLLLWNAAVAVLAGLGATALAGESDAARGARVRHAAAWLLGICAGVALLALFGRGLLAWGIGNPLPPGALTWSDAGLWMPLALAILSAAAASWWTARPSRVREALLVALLLWDLARFAGGWGWRHGVEAVRRPLATSPALEYLRARGEPSWSFRLASLDGGWQPHWTLKQWLTTGHPNLPALWELPTLGGLAYPTVRTARFTGYQDYPSLGRRREVPANPFFLDLMNVRYVLRPLGEFEELARQTGRWKNLMKDDEVEVLENLHARPRAWLTWETRTLPAEQVLKVLEGAPPDGAPFDPRTTALLEHDEAPFEGEDSAARVAIVSYAPQRVDLDVTSAKPAWLILADQHYPGWRVSVGGGPWQPSRVTNYLLRGVRVPAGRHRVTWDYAPASIRGGAAVSAGGLILLAASAWIMRRKQTA